jgi:hypothetical protein
MERTVFVGGENTTPPLTAHDRCDRCSAAAQVRVCLTDGGELLFCGHHGRMHQSALIQHGVIHGDLW